MIIIIARVTIRGGILILAIIHPLVNPIAALIIKAKMLAKIGFIWALTINHAATMFTIVTTDPIDRSMPPNSSTNAKPTAAMPSIDTCLATLSRLLERKNILCGDREKYNQR